MKPTLVVYASRYGYTRRYARWIAGQLGCETAEEKQVTAEQLAACEVLVYGGGLYAGGVNGAKHMFRDPQRLKGKELVLFTCGLADPADPPTEEYIRAQVQQTLPPDLRQRTRLFHLRGGIDYARLSLVHRAMMAMLRRMLLKKPENERTVQDEGILATYGKQPDFTDLETARPLVEAVRAL